MFRKPLPRLLALVLIIELGIGSSLAGDFPASSDEVYFEGRHSVSEGSATLSFPGVEIEAKFSGTSIGISGEVLGNNSHFNAYIDGIRLPQVDLSSGPFSIILAQGLNPNKEHILRLVRRNEAWLGSIRLDQITLSDSGKLIAHSNLKKRRIMCIGDSITCGDKSDMIGDYVENGSIAWNAESTFGSYLANDYNASLNLVSYGGKGLVRDWQGKSEPVTAPQFFERSLPDSPELEWDHSSYTPDLVTICLGTNDFSQGIVDEETFVTAYVSFVERIHTVHPEAKVLLISGPWFGKGDPKREALNSYIEKTVAEVNSKGKAYAHAHFFETTYLGTSRDPHPIAPQHREMADDISKTISTWLGW